MLDDIKNLFRHVKVYLLGKGILTLGVMAAVGISSAMGLGIMVPALVMGIGGTALTAANRFYQQSLYENDMLSLYRDTIAEQLGKRAEDVTRADLKEAAQENEVIAQALKRQHQRTWLDIGTAALSGAVSIGLIAGFGIDGSSLKEMAQQSLWGFLKPLAHLIGIGTISGLTGLVLKEGLGSAIGYGTGIHKAAAHDLIVGMDHDVARGLPISREQIYGVVVAANTALEKRIHTTYGKDYVQMSQAQKARVLHDYGLAGPLDELAVAMMNHEVRPGHLLTVVNDPRLASPKPAAANDNTVDAPAPATGKFVERLGLTQQKEAGHAERLAQQRDAQELAAVTR